MSPVKKAAIRNFNKIILNHICKNTKLIFSEVSAINTYMSKERIEIVSLLVLQKKQLPTTFM